LTDDSAAQVEGKRRRHTVALVAGVASGLAATGVAHEFVFAPKRYVVSVAHTSDTTIQWFFVVVAALVVGTLVRRLVTLELDRRVQRAHDARLPRAIVESQGDPNTTKLP
jgi:uncharacterized membrane protein YedE/YeeE